MSTKRKGSQKPKSNQPLWDILAGLSAAVGQTTQVTALLVPFLQNQELIAKIVDRPAFDRLASVLERDIRVMSQRFRAIVDQHANKTGQTANQTEWLQAIQLSEQYVEWASDFDDVILPTFSEITSMLRDAGADVTTLHAPSAAAAIVAAQPQV